MKLIGLTGNIGCGKSTVASLLSRYPRIHIIDCDALAKKMLPDKKLRTRLINILGHGAFVAGIPDTRKIAQIIFNNQRKRRVLEGFLHPLIWKKVATIARSRPKKLCIVESAIIYETGSESIFTSIIVAHCDRKEQFRRLHSSRKMSTHAIWRRVRSQLSQKEKVERAAYVIDTNCSLEELGRKVQQLYHTLTQERKSL